MRLLTSAVLLASALLLGACTMPGTPDDSTRLETTAGDRAQQTPGGATSGDASTPPSAGAPSGSQPRTSPVSPVEQAPPMSDPLPPEEVREPAASPAALDRSCRTSADCVVKNVGNCCGAMPACVNKDARPDPAAVQAQCERQGMSSICGFKEVTGCSCVAGTCQDEAGAVAQ